MEPGSPAFQVDSLLTELWGKPLTIRDRVYLPPLFFWIRIILLIWPIECDEIWVVRSAGLEFRRTCSGKPATIVWTSSGYFGRDWKTMLTNSCESTTKISRTDSFPPLTVGAETVSLQEENCPADLNSNEWLF